MSAAPTPEPDISASLTRALLELPQVVDGAVVIRQLGEQTFALLFVVMTATSQDERAFEALPVPVGVHRLIVPMRFLPRTADGAVDLNALDEMGLVETSSAARLEQGLLALPVEHGTVLVQPAREAPRRLHLTDLLRVAAEEPRRDEVEAEQAAPASTPAAPSEAIALVQAPSLPVSRELPDTLPGALQRAAQRFTDARITYLLETGGEAHQTFGQLVAEAEQTLAGLRALGLGPGAYVLLQLTEPRNIIPTFWGCLLGGFVPVICPVAPSYETMTADLEKLLHVWRLLDRPLIVADLSRKEQLPQLMRHLDGVSSIPTAETLRAHPADGGHHPAKSGDVAFLTLTSGSTGGPKCIALTHRNILSRGRGTSAMCDCGDDDVVLNWLPFDHIGSISDWHLRCVDLGCRMVYCTKERVLGNPLSWLELISQHRITHSWAPNFAYALINAALAGAPAGQSWDLSCMKWLLTAGESVSAATVEDFLTRLAPFGLARSAIRPAFGMAELGSGITYFRPTANQPYAALTVDRRSLAGILQPVPPQHPRGISFTALGTVIAGMAMRVVDDQGQVVRENVIGGLHVKGEAVMSGYVRNPEANAKVFVGDGWFDTGDRAFISSGQLFITGRNKETIIVNGANYFPGEIEAAAEQVAGVLVSYTAACAVRPPGARTERVALFLSHQALPERRRAELLREVQASVVRKTGVKPDYIIPLPRDRIPKTAVGKIQRRELTRRFEDGEFAEVLRAVDCLLENENTVPNWFFRPVWRRKALRGLSPRSLAPTIVVIDDGEWIDGLDTALMTTDARILRISSGPMFDREADSRWRVNWDDDEQLTSLCGELRRRRVTDFEVVDLTGIGAVSSVATWTRPAIESSLRRGCLRTLSWLKSLQKHELTPKRYWAISRGAQPGAGGASFEPGRCLTLALLKAWEHGVEGFTFHHIDVGADEAMRPQVIRDELREVRPDQQIAYRGGRRLACHLELVDWATAPRSPHPVLEPHQPGSGFSLVTGGLGGLGMEVTRLLLRRGARVLLVGRSSLSAGKNRDRLSELERLGQVLYREADVTVPELMEQAVREARSRWKVDLAGVFHLAGVGREAALAEETSDSVMPVLAPKVFGLSVIEGLLADRPDAYCVLFSSAVTIVDTSRTMAYAMANTYLDGWATEQRRRGRNVHALNWAPWEDKGMNAGWTVSPALRAKGLQSIPAALGLNSLLAAIGLAEPRVVIGLDPDNPRISSLLHRAHGAAAAQLEGYFSRGPSDRDRVFPPSLEGRDAFERPVTATLQEIDRIPLNAWGTVDTAALLAQLAGPKREKRPPQNEVQQKLVEIFARVLAVDVGINESFFDLGGTSLLALNLVGEIERVFGVRLGAATLIEAPTVEQIAGKLDSDSAAASESLVKITVDAGGAPLFLIHDADGETILYRSLALALSGTSVFALKPRGEDQMSALHTSIEQMSRYYIDRMREVQAKGPYMVGGLCAGGVIAFDIACRLQAEGEQVSMVVLLDAADARAPKVDEAGRRFRSALRDGDMSLGKILALGQKVRNAVKYRAEERLTRLQQRLKIMLLRETQKRGLKPPRVLQDLSPRMLYEFAQESYQPGKFDGKLLLFRATMGDQSQVERGIDDRPARETIADPLLGWASRATRGVEVVDVPGGHSSMLQPPHVTVLAGELRSRIVLAERRAAPRP